jgi:hypothetical protein
MDRQIARKVAADTQAALKEVAERYGMEVTVAGGSYDQGMYKPKVEFFEKAARDGKAEQGLKLLDLEGALGKTFKLKTKTFKVTGVNLRAPRFPVLATDQNGKVFKFPEGTVKRLLEV